MKKKKIKKQKPKEKHMFVVMNGYIDNTVLSIYLSINETLSDNYM